MKARESWKERGSRRGNGAEEGKDSKGSSGGGGNNASGIRDGGQHERAR